MPIPSPSVGVTERRSAIGEDRRRTNASAVVLAVVGGAAVIVSYTSLTWISGDTYPDEIPQVPLTFDQLRTLFRALNGAGQADQFGVMYFGGLAWISLVVCIAAFVGAVVPSAAQRKIQIGGVVLSIASLLLTYRSLFSGHGPWRLNQVYPGLWVACAGFTLIGVAFLRVAVAALSLSPDKEMARTSPEEEARNIGGPGTIDVIAAPFGLGVPAPPAVPAGWLSDPMRRWELRYWDGSAWTEHVSSQGQTGVDRIA